MSCLYPALNFTNLGKLLTLHCRRYGIVVMVASPDQAARITRTESPCRFNSRRILPYIAVNKDAFPSSPACAAGRIKSFRLPKQAQVSCVSFQAQYQAFVRFAVGSGAALSSHRAWLDLRFGTFHSGRALVLRTLASARNVPTGYLRGQQPWTDVMSGT